MGDIQSLKWDIDLIYMFFLATKFYRGYFKRNTSEKLTYKILQVVVFSRKHIFLPVDLLRIRSLGILSSS